MKTAFLFIFTCLISTGALLGALHAKNPYPNFGIAFSAWVFFILILNRRSGKGKRQVNAEQQFREYMRNKFDNHQH
ncbi:MAG: hypothetical protein M3O71_21215 [Bacteroidota bacterium]|nr:hypothetical protein [Bacteroidota bacterium]